MQVSVVILYRTQKLLDYNTSVLTPMIMLSLQKPKTNKTPAPEQNNKLTESIPNTVSINTKKYKAVFFFLPVYFATCKKNLDCSFPNSLSESVT